MSPIIRECISQNIDHFIIHSNQHYSENMDTLFFRELELEAPKYNLNAGSGLHGEMTAKIISSTEKILIEEKPDWILVQGDTNTVMAGAIAASKIGVKVGHVEAGLRSYDRTMPEEINRIVADHVSDCLFTPTQRQADILKNEAVDPRKIFVTGNTIVDAVNQNLALIEKHRELDHYKTDNFFLVTAHRPSNVDSEENLRELMSALTEVSIKYGILIIFPVHPRTKKQLEIFDINIDTKFIKLLDPVGYLEMLAMEKNAQLILTDSGGIQEEACILQVPSLTLRENTERPETIDVGASVLVGHNRIKILTESQKMLYGKHMWVNPFGKGNAAKQVLHHLLKSSTFNI